MSVYVMKLPDVGEGVAEAELVEWLVAVGDQVTPDTVIAEVLTDKASVEVSAPVAGQVNALHGEPGDILAVGADLIGIETGDAAPPEQADQPPEIDEGASPDESESSAAHLDAPRVAATPSGSGQQSTNRATAAPAVRRRAADLGLDLATIAGSGPDSRVMHADLDRELNRAGGARPRRPVDPLTTAEPDAGHAVPVRGIRRQIADRLSAAWRDIPHITYVDDVDVTELERLRAELNTESHVVSQVDGVRLTILPFLARAMTIALHDQPGINAHYDSSSEMLTTFDAVHIGIATQTDDGLKVAVVRHAERRGVWGLATEIGRITTAARDRSATRDELTGSTITITSLGALGGVVTTPIINAPEVAIIGVNKMETRAMWRNGSFQPRQMMNLSSSFDHRMVDGWDAATFVQRIKRLLESPALLFITDD